MPLARAANNPEFLGCITNGVGFEATVEYD